MAREYVKVETAHAVVVATIKIKVRGRVNLQHFEPEEFVADMIGISEFEYDEYNEELVELTDIESEYDEYEWYWPSQS